MNTMVILTETSGIIIMSLRHTRLWEGRNTMGVKVLDLVAQALMTGSVRVPVFVGLQTEQAPTDVPLGQGPK